MKLIAIKHLVLHWTRPQEILKLIKQRHQRREGYREIFFLARYTYPVSLLSFHIGPLREMIFKNPDAWSYLFNPISGIPALYHMFLHSEHILVVLGLPNLVEWL